MIIEEHIFAALTAGSPEPLRVFADEIPQYAVYPLVTYIIVAGEDDMHLQGASGLSRRLVQVDAWGRTRLGVGETIKIARSMMLAATTFAVGQVNVSGAPGYEPETKLYRASLEFSIHYETP